MTSQPRCRRPTRWRRTGVEGPREHTEPVEDRPLACREQRVRPVDGRSQRLMTLDRGAAPAGEQTEPLVEARRDLARAHTTTTRAAASSIARGMPSSRRQISATESALAASSTNSASAADRALHEQLDRIGRRDVELGAPLSGMASDRSDDHVLAATPRASRLVASRRTAGQERRMSSTRRRRGSKEVLTVVENDEDLHGRGGTRPCLQRHPLTGGHTKLVAIDLCHRVGSSTAASSQNHAPSGNRGRISAAACTDRRVLPTPPTPVRVTRRRNRVPRRSALSSRSRPTKDVSCKGRLPGNASSDRSVGKLKVVPDARGRRPSRAARDLVRRCAPRSVSSLRLAGGRERGRRPPATARSDRRGRLPSAAP